jgi:hypothetical protein
MELTVNKTSFSIKTFNNITMSDEELVVHMRKIFDIKEWLQEQTTYHRNADPYLNGPNGFYGHVPSDGGIILVESYGTPGYLFTPIGLIPVTGGGSDEKGDWLRKAIDKLGMVKLADQARDDQGVYGPVWQLTKDFEGNALPISDWESIKPKRPSDRNASFLNTVPNADYDTCEAIWERIRDRLNLKNPKE